MILKCDCKSDKYGNVQAAKFQNKHYGKNNRVFTQKQDGTPGKCTVCGKQYSGSYARKKK
jgi:hypothetical protein